MTGMAAAGIMIEGGVGILRTTPAPDAAAIDRFRLQTVALGWPWAPQLAYGEYLRTLDSEDPRQLAIIHAAGSLFRGAGYAVFDGDAPKVTLQAAVGAPYAHTTAPLRRLVDRFVLVICEALVAGYPVPSWVRSALPAIPAVMAASDGIASRLGRGSIDAVEAAVLRGRVGEVFDATVISARRGGGVIQLADPAVAAECSGQLEAGSRVRATLVAADIPTSTVRFSV
jgi:exoribonuclease R